MRKLLLATVAGLGAWGAVASDASAQTSPPMYSTGHVTTYSGGAALPTAAAPTPGTVVVRLNGRVRFYAFGAWDGDSNNNAAGSPTGVVNAAGQGTLTGTNKQASYGFGEYGRLYPGFDGVAANGLKYGANLEIRQDQVSGAGGGQFGSVSTANRSRAGLYFRRVWGYMGTDQLGTIRFGSIDSPSSLYMTGNFENFNDGGINGDLPGVMPYTSITFWPFADNGSYYTTNKVVYLSPQLFGFDMGVSFEPNTANTNLGFGCSANFTNPNFITQAGAMQPALGANGNFTTGPGCDRLYATPINSESGRRTNTFDTLIRYRGSFGPLGVAATAGYIGGSHVRDNSGQPFNSDPRLGALRLNYDGTSVGDFGLAFTVGGFSFGGKYMFGRFNTVLGILVPKGLPDGEAATVGASYTFGPMIVGAHGLYLKTAGDIGNAAQGRVRREIGFAAGGTYSLAPGLSLFLSYVRFDRKQNGFNFVTGQGVTAASPGGNPFSNRMTSQAIALGTALSW